MAARLLEASSKTLTRLFVHSPSDPLSISPSSSSFSLYLRCLHSFVSRRLDSPNCKRVLLGRNSRAMVTSSIPRFDALQEAVSAAAVNIDNRVPATVITGFLGSGKVAVLI